MSSSFSVLSLPLYFWDLYIEHLWNYKPGTWVYRIASTSWILAFLLVTPFIILTLLDVASYVIARTLGVVDATKASTGEMPVPASATDVPASSSAASDGIADDDVPAIHVVDPTPPPPSASKLDMRGGAAVHESTSYLRDNVVEEGNLKLSGVDAFSPAPSQPPSPTISRRDLGGPRFNVNVLPMTELSGEMRRKRAESEESAGEKEEEEEASGCASDGVKMRRRVRDRGEGDGRDE